jgi:hypothetical protein
MYWMAKVSTVFLISWMNLPKARLLKNPLFLSRNKHGQKNLLTLTQMLTLPRLRAESPISKPHAAAFSGAHFAYRQAVR